MIAMRTEFRDERQMRAYLEAHMIENNTRIQKLNERLESTERTDNPDRWDALSRIRFRQTVLIERQVTKMSFQEVGRLLHYHGY